MWWYFRCKGLGWAIVVCPTRYAGLRELLLWYPLQRGPYLPFSFIFVRLFRPHMLQLFDLLHDSPMFPFEALYIVCLCCLPWLGVLIPGLGAGKGLKNPLWYLTAKGMDLRLSVKGIFWDDFAVIWALLNGPIGDLLWRDFHILGYGHTLKICLGFPLQTHALRLVSINTLCLSYPHCSLQSTDLTLCPSI